MARLAPRSLSLIVALAGALAAAAAACTETGGAAVAPGAPAGNVVEVAGAVTASRGGQHRALHVGDTVSGDDVIATGDGGRVTIELRHNQVRWSLGPGKEKKVADSAAWTASKGTSEVEVTSEKTGAAGRHAEREAVDTSATAAAEPRARAEAAAPATPPPAPVAAAAPAPTAPARAAAPAPAPADEAKRSAVLELKSGGGGEVAALDADASAAGAVTGMPSPFRARANAGGVTVSDPAASGGLDQDAAQAAIAGHEGELAACKADGKQGELKANLAVRPDGRVAKVSLKRPLGLKPLDRCLQGVLRGLTFPKAKKKSAVTYTITFEK